MFMSRSNHSRRQSGKSNSKLRQARRMLFESLEQRALLAVTPASIVDAFNQGVTTFDQQLSNRIAEVAIGKVDLPIVSTKVNEALNLGSKIAEAVQNQIASSVTMTLEDARTELEGLGFEVQQLGTTADAQGDLLRIHRQFVWNGERTQFDVGGHAGFSYLEAGVDGQLQGMIEGTAQPIVLDLTLGVDLVNGVPSFYLADSTQLTAGVNIQGTAEGNLGIKSLLDVDVAGTLKIDVSAQVSFADADHKVRVGELISEVRGDLDGSVRFDNVSLTAKLPLIDDVHWTADFGANILDGQVSFAAPSLTAPSTASLLVSIGRGVLDAKNGFPLLGPIASLLNSEIPVIGKRIGETLGVGSALGWLLNSTNPDPSRIRQQLEGLGIKVHLPTDAQGAVQMIDKLIHGERVDLMSYETHGGKSWGFSEDSTLAKIPVGIGTIDIGGHLGANFGWDYYVGFGIDSLGFYIDPNTHIGVNGGAEAGLSGGFKLGGFLELASISGGIGLRAGASMGMFDPDPSDGRVYLDEIFRDGENIASSFLAAMDFQAYGDAYGYLKAEINLPWPLPDITLFDEQFQIASFWNVADGHTLQRTKRVRPASSDKPLDLPVLADGTLVINGDNLLGDRVILGGANGTVNVNWLGKGKGTFPNVTRVRFNGNGGNDRLEVLNGFNVRVEAYGGAGNDVLQGGLAADLLDGGADDDRLDGRAGDDLLYGQAGRDLVRGDAGNDKLYGHAGDDTLDGGDGIDTLYGGADHDYLLGAAGDDTLKGEAGNDVLRGGDGTDNLDGGLGNDQLFGDAGNDTLNGGAETDAKQADDLLFGGSGDDTLKGGIGNDVLQGESGLDKLYGDAGDDFLSGGDGSDTLDGGTDNDFLSGDGGNDTLLGQAGDDVIHGGAGTDTLRGGEGNDRLNGGADADSLYGDAGEDVLELDFASSSGTAIDKLFGGVGRDTVAVVGTTQSTVNSQTRKLQVSDNFDDVIHLVQINATTFRAENYDPATNQLLNSFNFTLLAGTQSDIETVGLYGLGGNDKLSAVVLAPTTTTGIPRGITLDGGEGNDELTGSIGQDLLQGGLGADRLYGGRGDDQLRGGDGNDEIYGEQGNDDLYGEVGDDALNGGEGSDVSFGGAGSDRIEAGLGMYGDIMYGDDESDDDGWDPGRETGNADIVTGGDGADVIFGNGGDDVLEGRGLNDVIMGGSGNDTIRGGAGADYLFGGDGDDVLFAFSDNPAEADAFLDMDWESKRAELEDYRIKIEDEFWALDAAIDGIDVLDGDDDNWVNDDPGMTSAGKQSLLDMLAAEQATLAQLKSDAFPDSSQARQIKLSTTRISVWDELDGKLDGSTSAGYDPAKAKVDLSELPSVLDLQGRIADKLPLATTLDNCRKFADALIYNMPSEYQNVVIDVVAGEAGNDTLHGTKFAEKMFGGSGDDTIYHSEGNDIVSGGTDSSGTDRDTYVFLGTEEKDNVRFERSSDSTTGQLVADVYIDDRPIGTLTFRSMEAIGIDMLGGDDTLVVHFGNAGDIGVDAYGGTGNDTIDASGLQAKAHLMGGEGNDVLIGGLGNDLLEGDEGSDTLEGRDGNDTLIGGAGNDFLYGGYAMDDVNDHLTLVAGEDRDWLRGGDGNDNLYGGADSDRLEGDNGENWLYGDEGDDSGLGQVGADNAVMQRGLFGGSDRDWMYGGSGRDRLDGGAGSDILNGDGDNDELYGGSEVDWLDGGTGRNIVRGDAGNDTLYINGGYDDLDGGPDFDYLSPYVSGGMIRVYGNNFLKGDGNSGCLKFAGIEGVNFIGDGLTVYRGGDAYVAGYGVFSGVFFANYVQINPQYWGWDASRDFSSSQNLNQWSYVWRALSTPSDITRLDWWTNLNYMKMNGGRISGAWAGTAPDALIGKWSGSGITMHPGGTIASVIAWRSPFTGTVRFSYQIRDLAPGLGDGVDWYLGRQSGSVTGSMDGNKDWWYINDGSTASDSITVHVKAGDFLYFALGPHGQGNNAADTTGVDIKIDALSMG